MPAEGRFTVRPVSHHRRTPHRRTRGRLAAAGLGLALAFALASCGSTDGASPDAVVLVTHDSFALSDALVADFEKETGLTLTIVTGGDAGEVVNKAVLAAGKPEGDVLFGVDNTLLTRALDAELFAPAEADLTALRTELAVGVDPEAGAVPVDDGDVCVNIDDAWFTARGVPPPASLGDLADPRYRDLLVVQNPATSSPGLAFLMATVAAYGPDGWPAYWQRLKDNGVAVVSGWTEAYTGEFTAGGQGGTRPLVVSYSSSPPAELVYAADPKPDRPGTSALLDGCFRQVEYAGVLRGAANPEGGQRLLEWLLSAEVQADVPLSMFVFPARAGVALPEVFAQWAPRPDAPLTVPAEEIAANREDWVREWTDLVLR
jgi:thiamine transport system substrate-binding protein